MATAVIMDRTIPSTYQRLIPSIKTVFAIIMRLAAVFTIYFVLVLLVFSSLLRCAFLSLRGFARPFSLRILSTPNPSTSSLCWYLLGLRIAFTVFSLFFAHSCRRILQHHSCWPQASGPIIHPGDDPRAGKGSTQNHINK